MIAPAPSLPASLTEAETRALRRFQIWLEKNLPGQVRRFILFGSKARGEVHPHSDMDLFVELSEGAPEQRDKVLDFALALMAEEEIDLSVIINDTAHVQSEIDLGTPFIRNVALDGLLLIGESIQVGKGKPDEVARAFFESAHHRLNATRLLIDGQEWRDAVSRAYYAMLDAADGVLAAIGLTPQSHAGTISLFSLHMVKTGRVERRYSRLLDEIQKSRLEADYERMIPVTEEKARSALATAEDFVATTAALLPQLLAEPAQADSNGGEAGE